MTRNSIDIEDMVDWVTKYREASGIATANSIFGDPVEKSRQARERNKTRREEIEYQYTHPVTVTTDDVVKGILYVIGAFAFGIFLAQGA